MTSVSFVVTIYNKAPVLPFLTAGLGAQEGGFEREFIFIDDGSTDGSAAVLRGLTAGWDNLTILSQPNAGPAAALNAGFERARGDYIKPMDGDDLLLPWATRRLIEAIETTGCRVAFAPPALTYDPDIPPELEVLAALLDQPGRIRRPVDMTCCGARSTARRPPRRPGWRAPRRCAAAAAAMGASSSRIIRSSCGSPSRAVSRGCTSRSFWRRRRSPHGSRTIEGADPPRT